MPVLFQTIIERADLHRNREVLYVFGDNLFGKGLGGQAKAMRGEPNAVGIPTKKRPAMDSGAFFTDDDYDEVVPVIAVRFDRLHRHLMRGGIVILPADGLGTGRAELDARAPRIAEDRRLHPNPDRHAVGPLSRLT